MLPLLLAAPTLAAAATDFTVYIVGVGALGTGGLLGYFWSHPAAPPATPTNSNASAKEEKHLQAAEVIQTETKNKRKRVLEKIGDEAMGHIEKVLEGAYKSRLKLNSLAQTFETQTHEMKQSTETLKKLIETLNLANTSAQGTVHHLSTEIDALKHNISTGSHAIEEATQKLSSKEVALANVVGQFKRMSVTLENTQLEYRTQISTLTEALQRSNSALNQKIANQPKQEEHIKRLQNKVVQLTACLQAVTPKKEGTAAHQSESQPEAITSIQYT